MYKLRAVRPEFLIVKVVPYQEEGGFWTIPSMVFGPDTALAEHEEALRGHILTTLTVRVGSFKLFSGGPFSTKSTHGITYSVPHVSGEVSRSGGYYRDHQWVTAEATPKYAFMPGARETIERFDQSTHWSFVR